MNHIIRQLRDDERLPVVLLLLADPDQGKIQTYGASGYVYVLERGGAIVGVYVLMAQADNQVEVMNVAVDERFQGQGLGTQLVKHAIAEARRMKFAQIMIKTGSTGVTQLYVYQKCGFRMAHIVPDHFINEYEQPIFENGIQLRDQVVLVQSLQESG
ncbi:GNAT family N-acetyltransferase [Geomicrobium sp. JSM 1781026]|uniref:GNAT family N-acetyltransferase n=1 Tax=Geomicrobium sp. JSM 1781026 TaxID=3344580 RepID=UPI0035C0A527